MELDNEINRELDKIKIKWQSTEEQYIGYKNYSKANMEKNQYKKNKLSHRGGQLENEVNKFELKRESLEREKGELEKYYDLLSLAFPERILEELLESTNNLEKQKLESTRKLEGYNENLNELNREIDSLKYHKSNKEGKLKELNIKIIEQEKWELEIAKALCHQLLEEYDGSLLNHNWFRNRGGEDLKFLENKKQEDLENIQRALWEKSLNKILSREEYFVPNPDVFKIKEEIKSLGIHVETGVEFLGELSEGEREKTLEDFPEILYGLIIASSRDWELIEKI